VERIEGRRRRYGVDRYFASAPRMCRRKNKGGGIWSGGDYPGQDCLSLGIVTGAELKIAGHQNTGGQTGTKTDKPQEKKEQGPRGSNSLNPRAGKKGQGKQRGKYKRGAGAREKTQ